jgi:Spy/CpxP family protein refolding chaperone
MAPILLVGLSLAWSVACRADPDVPEPAADTAAVGRAPAATGGSAAAANAKPDTPGAAIPAPRAPWQPVHKAPGHGIDQTVRRLTRGLDLDPAQQAKLREILWDEQRQVHKLRENPGSGVDWPSATATIVDQTKSRIRAILTDAQRTKYSSDVPREQTAPAQADLQHWMQLQETKRQQDDGASK